MEWFHLKWPDSRKTLLRIGVSGWRQFVDSKNYKTSFTQLEDVVALTQVQKDALLDFFLPIYEYQVPMANIAVSWEFPSIQVLCSNIFHYDITMVTASYGCYRHEQKNIINFWGGTGNINGKDNDRLPENNSKIWNTSDYVEYLKRSHQKPFKTPAHVMLTYVTVSVSIESQWPI